MSEATPAPEEWRAIAGWEGSYEVSDLGRVKSLPRAVPNGRGWYRPLPGGILKPRVTTTGYYSLNLCREGARTRGDVHILVAATFIGPRPPGQHVCHNNGDPLDNRLSNLRYGTPSENSQDTLRHGRNAWAARDHCKHGHPFTPENTQVRVDGARRCITCQQNASRASYLRKKVAA